MITTRNFTLSAILILFLGVVGCSHEARPPHDVMTETAMVDFLEQAYLLEGFYAVETGYHYDTLHPEMLASYDSLLASSGITRDDFERSIGWYGRHPDIYARVHDSVLARIDSALVEE
ncbi:MAG: DUF4296 domain-containing protein [Bacteroidales bacterium]|nr:DUF4296 domain-containing protein [Bacteroidales bacterium]